MSKEVYRALSSEARAEILKLVYQKARDIEELAESLKLQPVTIRHHVQALLEAGLLEFHEERSGLAGRPKTYYTIAKTLPSVVFPARRYYELSKSLVSSLRRNLGEKKTEEILADVGHDLGVETLKYLEAKNNVSKWSSKEFAEIIVKYFQEAGAEPEIIELSDNKLTYRLHNCLFSELSKEVPGLMCDIMHHQFQQAMLDSM
ncbi:MAG TPA: ArsR family transcriptional regulator, partial [Candidatus Binatia bacterium]|nr:ArsR family transcriptional regulator [Candidatus Binatia bacterium]